MAEYLSPGVYVEEYDNSPRSVEGVGTSTAGFVGMAEKGYDDGGEDAGPCSDALPRTARVEAGAPRPLRVDDASDLVSEGRDETQADRGDRRQVVHGHVKPRERCEQVAERVEQLAVSG